MSNRAKQSLLYLLIALLLVGAFYVGTAVVSTTAQQDVIFWPQATQAARVLPASVTDTEQRFADIYSHVAPSTVSINVVARGGRTVSGFGDDLQQGTGTGFVIDHDGHIVTNAHVVDNATRIEVNFFDGTIVRGELIGSDIDADLAVVKVDLPAEQLVPVSFANSDALFVGQEVAAIGSPFSQRWTMTTGIISALNRDIAGLGNYRIGSAIQTDAAINPGNSGGPLVDMNGAVIGVNAQILSQTRSASGVGFAIPSNLVQRVAQALKDHGRVDYSFLGISGSDVNLYYMESLGLPNNARGVVISRVEPDSPAAQGGLRSASNPRTIDGAEVPTSADIITAINGTPITSMSSLISYLAAETRPGQIVTMTVVRDGSEQLELPVTLQGRPTTNP